MSNIFNIEDYRTSHQAKKLINILNNAIKEARYGKIDKLDLGQKMIGEFIDDANVNVLELALDICSNNEIKILLKSMVIYCSENLEINSEHHATMIAIPMVFLKRFNDSSILETFDVDFIKNSLIEHGIVDESSLIYLNKSFVDNEILKTSYHQRSNLLKDLINQKHFSLENKSHDNIQLKFIIGTVIYDINKPSIFNERTAPLAFTGIGEEKMLQWRELILKKFKNEENFIDCLIPGRFNKSLNQGLELFNFINLNIHCDQIRHMNNTSDIFINISFDGKKTINIVFLKNGITIKKVPWSVTNFNNPESESDRIMDIFRKNNIL